MKKVIKTELAPGAIGPYSQGIDLGNMIFFSGQIPLDPKTNTIVTGDIKVQSHRSLDNLMAVLKEAGMDSSNVVKTTCFLKNIEDFAAFNEVYGEYFKEPAPARSCIEVARLPKDVLCEIELVAYKD